MVDKNIETNYLAYVNYTLTYASNLLFNIFNDNIIFINGAVIYYTHLTLNRPIKIKYITQR